MSYFLNQKYVHVVIGIIQNSNRHVLVSKRNAESHLGGLLEFPGGKVEKNESPIEALARELKEELNIESIECEPLIQIPYCYPDRKVLLDAYLVKKFTGKVVANEGQELFWQSIDIHDADDDSDTDVFSFDVSSAGLANITLTPKGAMYNVGPQGGTQTSFNTMALSDLSFEILDSEP